MSSFRSWVLTSSTGLLKSWLAAYQKDVDAHNKECAQCGRKSARVIDMCDTGYEWAGKMRTINQEIERREQDARDRSATLF